MAHGGRFRVALLLVVVIGTLGLIAELLLLEHTEAFNQWLPLAVLGAGLVGSMWVAIRPATGSLRLFQILMLAFVATGCLGVYLHYSSNVEFELEMYPTLKGWPLVWQSLKGAVPALAPGALAQLGLVGLVFTYGHPGLRAGPDGS
jgi:hypothetical protein